MQSLARKIHSFLFERSMTIFPVWLPRDQNVLADQISKFESLDDWEVSFDIFAFFDMRWGPHDFDLFASHSNAKNSILKSLVRAPVGQMPLDLIGQETIIGLPRPFHSLRGL